MIEGNTRIRRRLRPKRGRKPALRNIPANEKKAWSLYALGKSDVDSLTPPLPPIRTPAQAKVAKAMTGAQIERWSEKR